MIDRFIEPFDYDTNPERSHLTGLATERYSLSGDVHEVVVERFVAERITSVLDVGCGRGKLGGLFRSQGAEDAVGIDRSPTQLSTATSVLILGTALALAFSDDKFGGAAALYMLYHLQGPVAGVAECFRVLRPGGRRMCGQYLRFPRVSVYSSRLRSRHHVPKRQWC